MFEYNTTVNVNGDTLYNSRYRMGGCCCNGGYMNSCFGIGYMGGGTGFGLGMAAGMALVPALPAFFNWMGKTALPFAWNSIIKPVGIAIGSAAAWAGKGIAKGATAVYSAVIKPFYDKVLVPIGEGIGSAATAVASGVKNLWNKIFHKKSKSA